MFELILVQGQVYNALQNLHYVDTRSFQVIITFTKEMESLYGAAGMQCDNNCLKC